ncbi:glycosyltransferase family 4 protein [Polynucleobacter ibericus]|uniref:glycosyltransferase family 4 protein n=1 Tax=Polynucleobacter ibericus TaxID=1819725 RepID=UPI001BFD344A|nr:glycosyltransferase family 4 protein [Polynucleobacter ibericus]QWE08969.1 glycosyltransferase family 4 protein [Polynucleobacter ibericus]
MSHSKQKPLVCHFLIDHRIGGPHKYVEVCSRYMENDYESILFTCGKSKIQSVTLLNLRALNRFLYPIEVLINTIYILLIACYFRFKNRIIIFNIHGVHNLAPILAGLLLRIPSVLLIHESMRELKIFARISLFFLRHNSGKVLSVSQRGLNEYGAKQGEVVFSPVDVSYWKKSSCLRAYSFYALQSEKQPLRLVCVGNLNPIKGLDNLIDSLANSVGSIHVNIIGASMQSHFEYFVELKKKSQIAENMNPLLKINFLGWRETDEIRSFIYEAHIFVLPSLSEGCPIALIEAMATGCIPFVTDVGDVRQILSKTMPEVICDGYDSGSLNLGLSRLLEALYRLSPEEELLLREKFSKIATTQFDIPVVASKIMDTYKLMGGY